MACGVVRFVMAGKDRPGTFRSQVDIMSIIDLINFVVSRGLPHVPET